MASRRSSDERETGREQVASVSDGGADGIAHAAAEPHEQSVQPRLRALEEQARRNDDLFRQSERWLSAIFEQSAAGMAVAALDGRFVRVNPRLCEMYGYTEAEMEQLRFQDITHPDDLEADLDQYNRLLAGEIESYHMDKRNLRKDGSVIWVGIHTTLMRDDDGRPEYGIGVVQDITDRKAMENDQNQLLRMREATAAEMRAVQAITDTALAHLALDDLLPELVRRARDVLAAESVVILLLDADGKGLAVRGYTGLEEAELAADRWIPVGEGFAGRVAASRSPLVVDDLAVDETAGRYAPGRMRSVAGVPLTVHGELLGVLHVASTSPHRFDARDLRLLELVAERVALGVDRARLYEEARTARAEAEAERSRFQTVLEMLPAGVSISDASGRMVEVNAAFREVWGLTAPMLSDTAEYGEYKGWWTRTGERVAPDQWAMSRTIRTGEIVQDDEIDIETFDGQRKTILNRAAPLRNERGEITGGVVAMLDLTEHKQFEAERRRLEQHTREALDTLLEMAEVLVRDVDTPPAASPAHAPAPLDGLERERMFVQRLVALTHRVVAGHYTAALLVTPGLERIRPLAAAGLSPAVEARWWSSMAQGRVSDYATPDLMERLYAGETLTLDLSAHPPVPHQDYFGAHMLLIVPILLSTGDCLVVQAEARDRVAFAPQEVDLMHAAARLTALVLERERLLRERESSRAHALALEEANRRMDEFLGVASHELKTPLTTIKANIQIAERRADRMARVAAQSSGAQAEQLAGLRSILSRTVSAANRQERLVNDLLDVSRIQEGKLHLRIAPADLTGVVRDCVEEHRLAHPDRVFSADVPQGTTLVNADADRIGQVLTNYLSNAVKYSNEDRPIRVALTVTEDMARVSVRDEGAGLPPDELARIWDRFYQAPESRHKSGSRIGLGLGLYISRTIVERHGGQVGVRSTPGSGATFWFTLPLLARA